MDDKTITILTSLWKTITLTALIFGIILFLIDPLDDCVFYAIVWIIIGLCAGAVASHKGRKEVGWPVIYGITWGIIAFIYYAVSPKIEKPKEND